MFLVSMVLAQVQRAEDLGAKLDTNEDRVHRAGGLAAAVTTW
jgi:hypothetical protein